MIESDRLLWSVHGGDLSIDVAVALEDAALVDHSHDVVGTTCIGATVGLSADRHGRLEGACMVPERREARQVDVEAVSSSFLSGFRSARPAPSYLMEDVPVIWSRASGPRIDSEVAA